MRRRQKQQIFIGVFIGLFVIAVSVLGIIFYNHYQKEQINQRLAANTVHFASDGYNIAATMLLPKDQYAYEIKSEERTPSPPKSRRSGKPAAPTTSRPPKNEATSLSSKLTKPLARWEATPMMTIHITTSSKYHWFSVTKNGTNSTWTLKISAMLQVVKPCSNHPVSNHWSSLSGTTVITKRPTKNTPQMTEKS